MALITLSELKTQMGISGSGQDTELGYAVDGANDYVYRVTRRAWGETVTVVDEVHDFDAIVFLEHIGVSDITTVKVGYGTDFDTLTSDDYRWNSQGRILLSHDIRRSRSTWDFDEIKVTYDYGDLTVPDDLKMATLLLAQLSYNAGLVGGQSVTREKIGSREIEYQDGSVSIFDVIAGYRF